MSEKITDVNRRVCRLRPRFGSVLANLLVIIVPIMILILFDFAVIVEKFSYQRQFSEMRDRQTYESNSYALILADPVKAGDREHVRQYLKSFIADPHFAGALVSLPDGTTFAALGDDAATGVAELRLVRDIVDTASGSPVKIAQLTTLTTLKPILANLTQQRQQLTILAFIMLLTITGAVYVAYHVVAGRPLEQLLLAIRSRDHKNSGGPHCAARVECSGRDEIAELITDFNQAEAERADSHWQLLEAKLTLEQKVRERTDALAHALKRAESANQSKAVFLANMSHELRTPLNAIIGFAEVIQHSHADDQDIEPTHEQAVIIADSGRHLLGLLNTVLDYSKLQSGKMKLDEGEFDIVEVVQYAARTFSQAGKDKDISLVVEDHEGPAILTGDTSKITQIMLNLLSNAVKFTGSGGDITVSFHQDGDGIAVCVADTGPGLTPQELNIAMKPFEQAGNSDASNSGGTGLGLPLSREFAEMHDGTLKIASVKGEGTTVTLWLPASRLVSTGSEAAA